MNKFFKQGTTKITCSITILCSIFFLSNALYSQNYPSGVRKPDTIYPQKDVIDLIRKVLAIKRDSLPDSVKVKPGKLLLAFIPAVGYAPQTGPTALLAANLSFYVGKAANTNLSTIVFSQNYSLKNQIIIPVVSTIWTKENKFNFLGDWRYYKYPTYTYGLGSNTTLANADLIDYSYIKIHQQILKKIAKCFYSGVGYGLDYHFNIREKGDGSNFKEYNGNAALKTVSSGVLINVLFDNRHNINNPNDGIYFSVKYHPCFVAMGSDNNWQSIVGDFRKYLKLSSNGHHVLAFWSLNWFTFGGKVPYFDLPSTGWDTYSNSGRGYVQGRLRGTKMIYLETEYRFNVSRNGLFGGVLFANAESVPNWPDNKFQTVLPAIGTGIRIKVNKYSKVNFAIDYGVGLGGSKALYFNLSELF